MEDNKYYQIFRTLDLSVEPLPPNYNPEDFGRSLLSMLQTESGVSYSASTDRVAVLQGSCNTSNK